MTGISSLDTIIFLIASFGLTVIMTAFILPVLRKKKIGQNINELGPKWHAGKQGTPTMGGICFILAILLCFAAFFIFKAFDGGADEYIPLAMTLVLGVANGLIGFIDDYAKLIKKKNEGLNEWQKLVLQFTFAIAYVIVMAYTGYLGTSVGLPFTDKTLDLWYFAYPIYVIIIVGFVNSTNITDGIDGLAASMTTVVSSAILIVTMLDFNDSTAFASAALAGAMLGFLIFNANPAKIFMGDTGSNFIGGILMGIAFMTGNLIPVLVMGFVFIVEMLTSFWQRFYFKISKGKRFFKMAPIHHALEQSGWNEKKIVWVFSLATAVLCLAGSFLWYNTGNNLLTYTVTI